jgi:Transposase, Mutator family
MSGTSTVPRTPDGGKPARRPLVDDELAGQLLGKAQAEGVELPGPDGLLSQVTKAVLERALAGEMTGHLGYDKHDLAGRGSGNNRDGTTPKTVLTDAGATSRTVIVKWLAATMGMGEVGGRPLTGSWCRGAVMAVLWWQRGWRGSCGARGGFWAATRPRRGGRYGLGGRPRR